ncbi:SR-related and CTD-associated factor 4-like isoform X2 [Uloborus diversus]|uniref:SR-related and CTD-associated factor 4-like isoform X2 n=1 Tax=Uloborus diversus TaxID=327109 RepID=UPI00240A74B0|nr:SR-related and CTD-associated factor 4-like isoform X2 [Uloborus diversus]
MEVVRVFNNELSSLYEVKPPVSKAKMTQITKSAIKGIKFYKHIVQSVEKFIQKCRPEYKVPGLYVVDSIVRQSRHQFGADKDVFGPRFVKNISITFQHLFKCSEDDRPKIIRVLNLWQKNNVFPIDVIQPLLDMGHPNSATESLTTVEDAQNSRHKANDSSWKGWPQSNEEPVPENRTYAEITTTNLEKFTKAEMINSMEEEISRSSANKIQAKPVEETVKFNKDLLAFDYGDEEDEEEVKNDDGHLSNQTNALAFSMAQNFLSNPDLLKQIQQMQKTIQQNEALKAMNSDPAMQTQAKAADNDGTFQSEVHNSPQQHLLPSAPTYQQPIMPHNLQLSQSEADRDDRVLPEPQMPPRDLDERSLASVLASHDRVVPTMQYADGTNMLYSYDKSQMQFPPPQPGMNVLDSLSMERSFSQALPPEQHLLPNSGIDEDDRVMYSLPGEPPLPPQDFDERSLMMPTDERGRKEKSRSRSGSRSRGRGKHRSRSRSPRRKRSGSRSRTRKRSRSRERERIREKERERERERERRRKGIPPIKKGFISVCSTTIWLGHVPKSCSEIDISSLFSPYGSISCIDMIPPRGCAYVVMERRQDGHRALQKLKNAKLQGSTIKMAWAPGKGVKGKEYKDYWEVDLGVSYVPFEKVSDDSEALDLLEEGGFIDEDSLPDHLRALKKTPSEEKQSVNLSKVNNETSKPFNEMTTAPNMVPPPVIPPTSVALPMVMPHLMQPQFGLHLPGLLPPQAMVMQVPMGIPPPNPMLMVQPQAQNILNNQPLQMVGGVPQMVSRSVPPPVTSTLPSLKNIPRADHILGSPMVAATTTTGDATPTEEDGTSVSSPNVLPTSSAASTSLSISSTLAGSTLSQFNAQLSVHNVTRSMLSVPPPVSTAIAPIPYPPPNVNFTIPPPGVRPPGQGHIIPNSQFPWMPKLSNTSFDAESGQPNSSAPRSIVPPQSGTHLHMFGNRPPFHESSPTQPNTPIKDRSDRNSANVDSLGNRSISPRHDKSVEMVISTDDESSMDQEYPRAEIPPGGPGPRFPITEFPRIPLNMPRMLGPPPPGPMQGPRFSRGMHMGSPYPMRMGGPRGIGGHGMHPRMEMEFAMHAAGSLGPRIPTPHRNEMHPHEGRNWYNRDNPPFERDGDRHFRNDWNRDSWVTSDDVETNSAHLPRTNDGNRQDDSMDQWNRGGRLSEMEKGNNNETSFSSDKNNSPVKGDKFSSDKGDKKTDKPKLSKSLMHDMFKLQFYQRDQKPSISLSKKLEKSRLEKLEESRLQKLKAQNAEKENSTTLKPEDVKTENTIALSGVESEEKKSSNDSMQLLHSSGTTKRDRDARKRSRWGRTLSEEREFQEQKRFEIELKFQSYEQSHAAQQPPVNPNSETENPIPTENSSDVEVQNAPMNTNCDIVNTPVSQDNEVATHVQASEVASDLLDSTLSHSIKDETNINSMKSSDDKSDFESTITSSSQDNMANNNNTIAPAIMDSTVIDSSTVSTMIDNTDIVSPTVAPTRLDDIAMVNSESLSNTPLLKDDVAMIDNESVSNTPMVIDNSVNNENVSDIPEMTHPKDDVALVTLESVTNTPASKQIVTVNLENITSNQSDSLNTPTVLNEKINLDNMKSPILPNHLTESTIESGENTSDLTANTQDGVRTIPDDNERIENANITNSPLLSAEN